MTTPRTNRPTPTQYRRALGELLDALDRMYGSVGLSVNVLDAARRARLLVPPTKSPLDRSGHEEHREFTRPQRTGRTATR